MISRRISGLVAVIAVAMVAACGGSAPEAKAPTSTAKPKTGSADEVHAAAAKKFDTALAEVARRDEKADWNDAACTNVAQQFLDAVKEQKDATGQTLPEALYNAGIAYQRCSKHDDAKAQFQAALSASQSFHRAKVQLALYEYREKGDAVLDQTITRLNDAVIEAKFQNVDALVNLAMLMMKRNGPNRSQGCNDDMECAKLNVQRAMAIDDGYMPAFNQLALYYMNQARARAKRGSESGQKRRLVAADTEQSVLNGQMLDLAALVCSQAIRKNAKYGPIYNTFGLIQVEQKNINGAVQAFNSARTLDPNFFEAQMNYAAVNLSFRGFDKAEEAYRAALKMQPNSYEGRLGLALAIRGQINDSNLDANMAAADAELQKAKQIDPNRPEAFYNEAILLQEFKAKYMMDSTAAQIGLYESAAKMFDSFITKAGSAPEYAAAVKNSKDRKEDMKKMIDFIREGERIEAEQKKFEAEQKKQGANPPAPAPSSEGDSK